MWNNIIHFSKRVVMRIPDFSLACVLAIAVSLMIAPTLAVEQRWLTFLLAVMLACCFAGERIGSKVCHKFITKPSYEYKVDSDTFNLSVYNYIPPLRLTLRNNSKRTLCLKNLRVNVLYKSNVTDTIYVLASQSLILRNKLKYLEHKVELIPLIPNEALRNELIKLISGISVPKPVWIVVFDLEVHICCWGCRIPVRFEGELESSL